MRDNREILETGPIGVWDSMHSIGQPAGSSYTNAVVTAILGKSIWSAYTQHRCKNYRVGLRGDVTITPAG